MACLDMSMYRYLDSLLWIHLFTPEKAFHFTKYSNPVIIKLFLDSKKYEY